MNLKYLCALNIAIKYLDQDSAPNQNDKLDQDPNRNVTDPPHWYRYGTGYLDKLL